MGDLDFEDLWMRRGKFQIDRSLMQKRIDHVMFIMSKVIIMRAESFMFDEWVEYLAISQMFDRVSVGELVPEYRFEIKVNESNIPVRIDAYRQG